MASLSQGRTAAAQCGLFTHKSVPVIFEPPCILHTCSLEVFIFCSLLTLDCCFQCFDDTEKLQWEHIESEWKQEKQKALNALAGTSEDFLNLSLQPEVKGKFFIYRTPF